MTVVPHLATGWTRPQLLARLAAMQVPPNLINRPIVRSPRAVRLCRPSASVLDRLDRRPAGPITKEDGTLLIDAEGNRVV